MTLPVATTGAGRELGATAARGAGTGSGKPVEPIRPALAADLDKALRSSRPVVPAPDEPAARTPALGAVIAAAQSVETSHPHRSLPPDEGAERYRAGARLTLLDAPLTRRLA
ncbi:MAG: hypothetical protein EA405_08030 [Rhodospirillales bacterium]|nr:MAG: hypothetical protein EA405_08030 [Rhodospirillales bacterium]